MVFSNFTGNPGSLCVSRIVCVAGVKRLALDNIEGSDIGHLMNFTQRIISIMERDWNVE